MRHTLEREQLVPRGLEEVFGFFADAANLELLTPSSLHFEILTPMPVKLVPGALIDYRLRLFGVPFHWVTEIESFQQDRRFCDIQRRGPYRSWRHTHEFEERPGGTLVRDRVEYEIPLGPLGELAGLLFVHRQVQHIFDYRRETLDRIFARA